MTTIDFFAGTESHARFSLHGGLGSPAAQALNLLVDAIRAGAVKGEFAVEVTAPHVGGGDLRKLLAPMAGVERWTSPLVANHPLFHNGDELLDYIDVEATYCVSAMEV